MMESFEFFLIFLLQGFSFFKLLEFSCLLLLLFHPFFSSLCLHLLEETLILFSSFLLLLT
jgi:hypothetical protein